MKNKFSIESNKNGFSIWLNKSWILDASTFLEDGSVDICTKRFIRKTNDDLGRMTLRARGFKANKSLNTDK